MNAKHIAIIGLGRIGLPTAVNISNFDFTVCGIDRDPHLIAMLCRGELPFQEKKLSSASLANVDFQEKLADRVPDWIIVAIPTLNQDGRFGIESILEFLNDAPPKIPIIIESTLPIGGFSKLRKETQAPLVYCPERVAPGQVFEELHGVSRCIASDDLQLLQRAKDFYHEVGISTVVTSPKTAEFVKLSENAYRDANIAFANQLAEICGQHGVNVREVIQLANTHPRVNILTPGLGAGGACLAPSTRGLSTDGFLQTVREINERQIVRLLHRIQEKHVRTIALWGMSYKPSCDDIRFSRAAALHAQFEGAGIRVRIWDPVAKIGDRADSVQDADAIVFGVAHPHFRDLSPYEISDGMRSKLIFDFVGAIDVFKWIDAGFSCISE